MTTRLTMRLGAVALALAFAAAPAMAMSKKAGHHMGAAHHDSSDHMADQLNAQSLTAAHSGSNYAPGSGTMSNEHMNAPMDAPMHSPMNAPMNAPMRSHDSSM
jgi:hypothetical protein